VRFQEVIKKAVDISQLVNYALFQCRPPERGKLLDIQLLPRTSEDDYLCFSTQYWGLVIPIILGDAEEKGVPEGIRNLGCLYAKDWDYEQLISRIRTRLLKSVEVEEAEEPSGRLEKDER